MREKQPGFFYGKMRLNFFEKGDLMGENYQLILDKTLEHIQKENRVPSLLLHSCCGPCSTYVLDYLSDFFEITVYYYNPNIYPKEEYLFREAEQEDFIHRFAGKHPVHFKRAPYDPEDYYQRVRGHEEDPERGERCSLCYWMRLEAAAQLAQKEGYDYFTTTLSLSPHKDAQRLNRMGRELEEKYGVAYLYSDFKKRDGFKRSKALTDEYGMYRQDYCGCVFSYRDRQDYLKRQAAEAKERKEMSGKPLNKR